LTAGSHLTIRKVGPADLEPQEYLVSLFRSLMHAFTVRSTTGMARLGVKMTQLNGLSPVFFALEQAISSVFTTFILE
jgi:hypothetical protein